MVNLKAGHLKWKFSNELKWLLGIDNDEWIVKKIVRVLAFLIWRENFIKLIKQEKEV